MNLDIDILSLDSSLSLDSLLSNEMGHFDALVQHLDKGNRLSLGVIPTGSPKEESQDFSANTHWNALNQKLDSNLEGKSEGAKNLKTKILETSIYTPACGLALHGTTETEQILHCLLNFASLAKNEQTEH